MPSDELTTSIRNDIGEDVEIHDSSRPDAVFVTSRDTIELTLRKYKQGVLSKTKWINPMLLFSTILSVHMVSSFKDFLGISSETWSSFYLVLLLGSVIWLIYTIYDFYVNWEKAKIEFVIKELESKNNT